MTGPRRPTTFVGILAVSLLGVAACHSKTNTRNQPAPCVGERVAVRVHNASTAPVDVYLHTGKSRSGSILGTAPVGGAEFRLPPTDKKFAVWFEARRSDGTPIVPAMGNRAEFNRITYDVICQE